MAELDYAYLADFAQIADGKLSAIGASFTVVRVAEFPTQQILSLAGRVRSTVDAAPTPFVIRATGPNESFNIEFEGELSRGPNLLPYDGTKIGLLFAFTFGMPLITEGLYRIELLLEGELVRTLIFSAESAVS